MAGEADGRDPWWQANARHARTVTVNGIIGLILALVGMGMVLVVAPPSAGHPLTTAVWIMAGLVVAMAVLSIGVGALIRAVSLAMLGGTSPLTTGRHHPEAVGR